MRSPMGKASSSRTPGVEEGEGTQIFSTLVTPMTPNSPVKGVPEALQLLRAKLKSSDPVYAAHFF